MFFAHLKYMWSEQTNHSKKWHLAVNFYSLKAQAAVMHTAAFVGKINDTWNAKQIDAQSNQL